MKRGVPVVALGLVLAVSEVGGCAGEQSPTAEQSRAPANSLPACSILNQNGTPAAFDTLPQGPGQQYEITTDRKITSTAYINIGTDPTNTSYHIGIEEKKFGSQAKWATFKVGSATVTLSKVCRNGEGQAEPQLENGFLTEYLYYDFGRRIVTSKSSAPQASPSGSR
jgi:hypothetical protein